MSVKARDPQLFVLDGRRKTTFWQLRRANDRAAVAAVAVSFCSRFVTVV
ncbi:hypothetical protein [Bradyrhizobium sp. ORS 375]|nr:hypothetical protein [Bradyrhizobium sp. ORS 375]